MSRPGILSELRVKIELAPFHHTLFMRDILDQVNKVKLRVFAETVFL